MLPVRLPRDEPRSQGLGGQQSPSTASSQKLLGIPSDDREEDFDLTAATIIA
jgi:hypothetical protein